MNHIQTKNGKDKRKRGGRPHLSPFAMKAVSQLRRKPRSQTAFSLYVTKEGTKRAFEVIEHGEGPDSAYYIHLSEGGSIPPTLPPTATYAVSTDSELESVLAMFADHPELWSRDPGDALDRPTEPFDENEWEAPEEGE